MFLSLGTHTTPAHRCRGYVSFPFSRDRFRDARRKMRSAESENNTSVVESNGAATECSEVFVDSSNGFGLDPPGLSEENKDRVSRYQAARLCSRTIQEKGRPLSEYMTLPVSQYSVLDAEKVERLGEDLFKVETGAVGFLGVKVIPILTLMVKGHDTGCEVTLLKCTLDGNKLVRDANSRFACQMRNYVSYHKDPETEELKITGDCSLKIAGIVPGWISAVFPVNVVNGLGEKMLSQILRIAMPRFLEQLERDYAAWAAGDDSRQPMGTGEFTMTESLASDTSQTLDD